MWRLSAIAKGSRIHCSYRHTAGCHNAGKDSKKVQNRNTGFPQKRNGLVDFVLEDHFSSRKREVKLAGKLLPEK